VSRLSRIYASLDISQPYGPPWHVAGIALLLPKVTRVVSMQVRYSEATESDGWMNVAFMCLLFPHRHSNILPSQLIMIVNRHFKVLLLDMG
jgi:hypothetical protein